jgi:endonuclease/exonuclease/phosphatase family metal-dependent hydrolase
MNRSPWIILPFGIFFLLLIQLSGTLVESIYILDLMNTALDEKALGLLFFFSPALLLFVRKQLPGPVLWGIAGLLLITRGLAPYLNTLGRMLVSGAGTGGILLLFPTMLTARDEGTGNRHTGTQLSAGLALATAASAFLRTWGYGLDYSLLPEGGWVGWGLGGIFALSLLRLDLGSKLESKKQREPLASPVTGVFLAIALVYFAFSAPSVIARWTEGDYRLIVSIVSLLAISWIAVSLYWPGWIEAATPKVLLAWNTLFAASLTGTLLVHRVPFLQTPDAPAVVVYAPTWVQQLPLFLTLLLFPVIFLDMRILGARIQHARPSPRAFAPGLLLGALALVLLVFIHIFTNVWGYVEPVSPWFRNKFWLPYLLMAGGLTLIVGRARKGSAGDSSVPNAAPGQWSAALLVTLFLATAGSTVYTTRVKTFDPPENSLLVMTYNVQQGNDFAGERSYRQQLELMQIVSPDLIALQETDSARVSLNNNDYVRYYAGKLGYYSYYGPKTVAGTYGTAILSKYPLLNTRSAFSFSGQDEVGTAEAELEIDGRTFTIYDVHPDGSDTAMSAFAKSLLSRSRDKDNVIALGDYNLNEYEPAYQPIAGAFTNAWESVYPGKISPDGTDMSGENRIDHIFLSQPLLVRDPVYLLPPASGTDHPAHWAVIYWNE